MVGHTTEVIQVNEKDQICIRLTEGEFADILFCIDNVRFSDPTEDDKVIMSFDYDVIENRGEPFSDVKNEKFEQVIGDLILGVLENQIEQGYNGGIAFTGGV